MSTSNSPLGAEPKSASLVVDRQVTRVFLVRVEGAGSPVGIHMMDKVSGMLEKMKLTDKEKKGLRIGKMQVATNVPKDPQAVGKVLSEKPVRAESIEAALGKIWCPIRGVECKELETIIFSSRSYRRRGRREHLMMGHGCLART